MLVTLEGTFATNAQEVHAQIQVVISHFFFNTSLLLGKLTLIASCNQSQEVH